MNWNAVTSLDAILELEMASHDRPIIILKHSTRCGISSVILDRLSRQWDEASMADITPVIVDVVRARDISNFIAEKYNVRHESPQMLIIWKSKVIHHSSHMGINFASLSSVIVPIINN